MAQLFPDRSASQMQTRGYWREIEVLTTLQQSMPEGYGVAASIPHERIFNSDDIPNLASALQQLLPSSPEHLNAQSVHAFQSNHLNVVLLQDQLQSPTHRLPDRLSTGVSRMHAPSSYYRIQSADGSGKAQIAFYDAANAGQRACYVYFNHQQADHIVRLPSSRISVPTFHFRCIEHCKHSQPSLNFNVPTIFEAATQDGQRAMEDYTADLDLPMIDEEQDFDSNRAQRLINQKEEDDRLYLLEENDQNLYWHKFFDPQDEGSITCHDKLRGTI